jgi:hypothetical protein
LLYEQTFQVHSNTAEESLSTTGLERFELGVEFHVKFTSPQVVNNNPALTGR